ncbi:ribosomal-protein-alanine N-acetyltransferase [bacterium B13(2017)]|nr:ribosomal-protein-alanine N-acetyltransferase [bacterium B13(2017)]
MNKKNNNIVLSIRSIIKNDIDQIINIENQSNPNPWSRKIFEKELLIINSIHLAGISNNQIVTYIFSWIVHDELHIHNIATHPIFRLKGFAKKILFKTIQIAKQKNVKIIDLDVRESNIHAISFYKKIGFIENGMRNNYYSNQENAILMRYNIQQ